MPSKTSTPEQAESMTTALYNRQFIYTAPENVAFDLTLTLTDLRIYMTVRSFMDTTGDAYPSNGWLAQKLGVTPETISRSISKMVEKQHLGRIEINGRRHLMVGKPIPESLVSCRGVDVNVKKGCELDQMRVDKKINQLDQSTIHTKNNARASVSVSEQEPAKKTWIEAANELKDFWEQELVPVGIDVKYGDLQKWHARYGMDYLREKLEYAKAKGFGDHPPALYTAAVKKDYKISQPKAHSRAQNFTPAEIMQVERELTPEEIARKEEIDRHGLASLEALKKLVASSSVSEHKSFGDEDMAFDW